MGDARNDTAVEHLKGREHIGRPRHRWEDSIKVDFKEISV
jgi:hypothetical protein